MSKKNLSDAKIEEPTNLMETNDDKIIRLLEENLEISKESLKSNKKVTRWVTWQKIKFWVYFVLIIVPLGLAVFYLPPILNQGLEQYRDLLNSFMAIGQQGNLNDVNLEDFKRMR
ncbi:MAG: hypothetical protein U9O55_03355 [Patescibacteria group bacterium]|nr:hypothetical protein [Patescibacteria group bacterium]